MLFGKVNSMKMRDIIYLLIGGVSLCVAEEPVNHAKADMPVPATQKQEPPEERDARMKWWRDAKFGMFIHYGLYSGLAGEFQGRPGGGEWIQCNLGLDTDTYAAEALPLFKPAPGCAEAWAELAKEAGCRYMVLTSKHHEGFALFDAINTDYCSGKLLQRDLVKEFTDAARAAGMRVGLYHSVIDWHQKDYDHTICPDLCYPVNQAAMLKEKQIPRNQTAYQDYLHTQVRQLVRNYGPIDIMWWDYSQGAAEGAAWKAQELMETCRAENPGVIFNNRLYSFSGFDANEDTKALDFSKGDFSTPEKRIPREGYPGRDWEACMTVGNHWGYNRHDYKNYKSPEQIIYQLQECAAKGGNLLLNIGPKADGTVPEGIVDVFKRVGAWMRVNGESIYSSRPMQPDSLDLPEDLLASVVWDDIYIFLPKREPGEEELDYVLSIPANQVNAVYPTILGQDECEVSMERVEETDEHGEKQYYLDITIPAEAWTQAVEGLPVLKLGYDG